MVEICYLLLCHKKPDDVIEQIEYLVESGGRVVYHMDKNASSASHKVLSNHFKGNDRVLTVNSVSAGWGDWSLVNATLRMINRALESFNDVTHFYYLSGDCVPIRSHEDLKAHLRGKTADMIETADFVNGNWIKTGPHMERIKFYHHFNERKRKWLFYKSYDIQRMLGISRKVPDGLQLSIGSQWWCLRRKTLERIMMFLAVRRDVVKFFKRCWIPDEMFFQTLVATLVPKNERKSEPPTFLRFSDYGLPTVFYDDHYDFLISQDKFFARKVSENSKRLKKRLIKRFVSPATNEHVYDSGAETISFITYTGREGLRYGPRIWQRYDHISDDKRVFVIVSKKWHVGNRMGEALAEVTGIPYVGYLFDESKMNMGNLGNFEHHMQKRRAHPAAYLRMLISAQNLNQVIIGMDSSRINELKHLQEHTADLRVIELENEFSPEFIDGHAERSGLMVAHGNSQQRNALHKAIIETFKNETQKMRNLHIRKFEKISGWHNAKMRAEMLSNQFERDSVDFLNLARHVEIKD